MPRRPQFPTRMEERRHDSREDVARTLLLLRKAVERRGPISVQTFCDCLLRRLAVTPITADDREEIAASVQLVRDRVKHGLDERLRRLLLPIVSAVETQIELCE